MTSSLRELLYASNSTINNSKAKQQFSFPKAQRFPKIKKPICSSTYYSI